MTQWTDEQAQAFYDALKLARQYIVLAVIDGRDGNLASHRETNADLLKHAERDLATIDAALSRATGARR